MAFWKNEKRVLGPLAAKENAPYRNCGGRFFRVAGWRGVFAQSVTSAATPASVQFSKPQSADPFAETFHAVERNQRSRSSALLARLIIGKARADWTLQQGFLCVDIAARFCGRGYETRNRDLRYDPARRQPGRGGEFFCDGQTPHRRQTGCVRDSLY